MMFGWQAGLACLVTMATLWPNHLWVTKVRVWGRWLKVRRAWISAAAACLAPSQGQLMHLTAQGTHRPWSSTSALHRSMAALLEEATLQQVLHWQTVYTQTSQHKLKRRGKVRPIQQQTPAAGEQHLAAVLQCPTDGAGRAGQGDSDSTRTMSTVASLKRCTHYVTWL